MVAIIKCTEEEQRHLTWLEELHNPRHQDEWVWNTTRPRRYWPKGAHLTLIVTGNYRDVPEISRLSWTKRVRPGDDLGEKLELSRIRSTGKPIPLSDLMDELPQKFHRHLVPEGQQSDSIACGPWTALRRCSAVRETASGSYAVPAGSSSATRKPSYQRRTT